MTRPAFRMTTTRIKRLRAYAHGRKGLDSDTYALHREAVGARSTTELTYPQFAALMKRLGRLPDVAPKRGARA